MSDPVAHVVSNNKYPPSCGRLRSRSEVELMIKTENRYQTIYAVVKLIPPGFVATYGQIARLAGLQGGARQVGYALHALADGFSVPWHRVVNAQGRISPRSGGSPADLIQRLRLEAEGVEFDEQGRIVLPRFQWRP